jgi:hypothetical protein
MPGRSTPISHGVLGTLAEASVAAPRRDPGEPWKKSTGSPLASPNAS